MGLDKSLLQFSAIAIFSLIVAGCSNAPLQKPDLPEEEYYQQAQEAMGDNRPSVAVEHLKDLDSRYPFGKFSERVKLELIYANFLAADYVAAHAAADSFIQSYPSHDFLDYAFYYRALSTYKGAETLSYRFLDQELSKRDVSALNTAFDEFAELLQRYPHSSYAVDAKARMIFLRNNIAEHEIHIARYYFKRNAPLAALKRGQNVIMNYPSSQSVEEGLAVVIQAYTELEESELANKYLDILALNYPDSSYLAKDGQFITPEPPKDQKPDFWYWVTLGWID